MPTQNINVGRGLNPEVELFGDWDKALNVFNNLQSSITIGSRLGKLAAAKKIQALIKKNIRANGPPGVHWPALSTEYARSKKSRGGDPNKKWFFSGTYYRNIRIIEKGKNVYVGVPARARSTVNKKKPLTLGQIANILERGSAARGIEARPLWGPTFREFGGKRRIAYHITWHISNQIYLTSGFRPQIRY